MNNTYDVKVWEKKVNDLFPKLAIDSFIQEAVINTCYRDTKPTDISAVLGKLAYKVGLNEAISVIKELDGQLYEIHDKKLWNKYMIPKSLRVDKWNYHLLPPAVEEPSIDCTKEAQLNSNHHYNQNLKFLNKIQRIPFVLDPDVIMYETPQGIAGNAHRHNRVLLDYLGKTFYFNWRFDKRGRSYTRGWDINLQSDEYHKAKISLANEKMIDDLVPLKIAIANHAGQDKLSWTGRIRWFDAQNGEFDTEQWDEPILGRKALRAYQNAIDGKPSGYMMSIDATASGLQIMTALSDCRESAVRVNLTGDNHRHDVYAHVANAMNAELSVENLVDRSMVKKPLMTKFYNSEKQPKIAFNEEQLKAFNDSLQGLLPGPMKVMALLNKCWDNKALAHTWTLPDNHTAHCKVEETVNYIIHDDKLGDIPISFNQNRCSDNYRSLAPNIIHSIDGWIAREMISRCHFDVVHIHDSFWFHPNHFYEVAITYREILADLNKMDLLAKIVKQLTGTDVKCSNGTISKEILQSMYALS